LKRQHAKFIYCLFMLNLPTKKKKVLLPAGVSKSAAHTVPRQLAAGRETAVHKSLKGPLARTGIE
jgi:hypothetical protein